MPPVQHYHIPTQKITNSDDDEKSSEFLVDLRSPNKLFSGSSENRVSKSPGALIDSDAKPTFRSAGTLPVPEPSKNMYQYNKPQRNQILQKSGVQVTKKVDAIVNELPLRNASNSTLIDNESDQKIVDQGHPYRRDLRLSTLDSDVGTQHTTYSETKYAVVKITDPKSGLASYGTRSKAIGGGNNGKIGPMYGNLDYFSGYRSDGDQKMVRTVDSREEFVSNSNFHGQTQTQMNINKNDRYAAMTGNLQKQTINTNDRYTAFTQQQVQQQNEVRKSVESNLHSQSSKQYANFCALDKSGISNSESQHLNGLTVPITRAVKSVEICENKRSIWKEHSEPCNNKEIHQIKLECDQKVIIKGEHVKEIEKTVPCKKFTMVREKVPVKKIVKKLVCVPVVKTIEVETTDVKEIEEEVIEYEDKWIRKEYTEDKKITDYIIKPYEKVVSIPYIQIQEVEKMRQSMKKCWKEEIVCDTEKREVIKEKTCQENVLAYLNKGQEHCEN